MLKNLFKKWQYKLIIIPIPVILLGLILAILGDTDGFHDLEDPGLYIMGFGFVLLVLSIIFLVFYKIIKSKNYRLFIGFIISFVILILTLIGFTLTLSGLIEPEQGFLIMCLGSILFILSLLFNIFYQIYRNKKYKLLIGLISGFIIVVLALIFFGPIEWMTIERSGTLCKFRGGEFESYGHSIIRTCAEPHYCDYPMMCD